MAGVGVAETGPQPLTQLSNLQSREARPKAVSP